MNAFIAGVARAAIETFEFPQPILELGSRQVAGQEALADLRRHFPHSRYYGIDRCPGPGVEVQGEIERLPLPDACAGSVLALNVFEHVPRFWRGFEEARRVLRPDGLLLVSVPFYFRIHRFPQDYWRFTPEAMDLLLREMPSAIIGYHGPEKRPLNVWGLAAGPDYPRIEEARHRRFQELIARYARQPLSPMDRWRYGIGQMICGRRPFEIFLQAEHFSSVLRSAGCGGRLNRDTHPFGVASP